MNFVRRFFDVQSVNLATVRCRKMQNGVIFKPLHMQNGIHIHVDLVTLSHLFSRFKVAIYFPLGFDK